MSAPNELNRLHDVCAAVAELIGGGFNITGKEVADLREALKPFDLQGNIRTEPAGIYPQFVANWFMQLNESLLMQCTSGGMDLKKAEWADAHIKIALVHDQTLEILAIEK